MIDSIADLTQITQAPQASKGQSSVRSAAVQFEALLFAQMLKTAREAGGSSWMGAGEDDDAGETGVEVAEQQFARALASAGGLGLAGLIAKGLEQDQAATNPSGRPTTGAQSPVVSGE